ncbi:unnamed protein product [Rhizophagus irregularis]|nr:unnamed protein product [Rhizophagus irregularis]
MKWNVDLGQLTLGSFKASLVLIDTFFGFEEIGPILSEEYPPLTPELSDFINGHERVYMYLLVHFTPQPPIITVNFYNYLLKQLTKKIIDGVVWALVETPKDYFYPTLKLSDGTQVQTSQILNNEHPHIHIAEFVPQFPYEKNAFGKYSENCPDIIVQIPDKMSVLKNIRKRARFGTFSGH